MLMSTEAATMPSVTLSNYEPLTRLGLHYELFAARMSESKNIVFGDGRTDGHPRLAGIHLGMEPAQGWALGLNRLIQYGGGSLGGGGFHDLFRALFNPSAAQTVTTANGQPFGDFRLEQVVLDSRSLPPSDLVDRLLTEIRSWPPPSTGQTDDITVVVIDVT